MAVRAIDGLGIDILDCLACRQADSELRFAHPNPTNTQSMDATGELLLPRQPLGCLDNGELSRPGLS